MSYLKNSLSEQENIALWLPMHWLFFARKGVVFIFAIVIFVLTLNDTYTMTAWPNSASEIFSYISILLMISSLLPFLEYILTRQVITSLRVVKYTNLIFKKSTEVMIKDIEMVTINQSILGSTLNYGSIEILTNNKHKFVLNGIKSPIKAKASIENQITKEARYAYLH